MASRPLFIVGERDGGKSTTLIRLLSELPWRAMRTCGVLALANVGKTQYTLKDLGSKETRLALSCEPHDGWKRLGKFSYDEDAFNWANKRIIRSLPQAELAGFDEIGRLEMEGGGLAPSFAEALGRDGVLVAAVVRTPFVEAVKECFGIEAIDVIVCQRDENE